MHPLWRSAIATALGFGSNTCMTAGICFYIIGHTLVYIDFPQIPGLVRFDVGTLKHCRHHQGAITARIRLCYAMTTTILPFKSLLIAAALLRVGLIIYSEWHDARSAVKYTDIDYRVFSDAARFILNPDPSTGNVAQGPLARYFRLGE